MRRGKAVVDRPVAVVVHVVADLGVGRGAPGRSPCVRRTLRRRTSAPCVTMRDIDAEGTHIASGRRRGHAVRDGTSSCESAGSAAGRREGATRWRRADAPGAEVRRSPPAAPATRTANVPTAAARFASMHRPRGSLRSPARRRVPRRPRPLAPPPPRQRPIRSPTDALEDPRTRARGDRPTLRTGPLGGRRLGRARPSLRVGARDRAARVARDAPADGRRRLGLRRGAR